MAHRMKVTISNIIGLWFGADTPIRQYKIVTNPEVWAACLHIADDFTPDSGALSPEQYRKSDKVSFARAVQAKLSEADASVMA
ncbi:hypothetical protein [Spirosoma endbachense]|uniref:Uncharacterized protein n=1 Tax=Spirosoma endbachense TaxID=2666025 RepID=A0A6P1VXV2_9BACT|nr:hypothetical protein [Spirosoma endbachense]QHV96529.1 hypothetical protein GJR95_16575 [Spirosoma endbachense]